MRKPALYTAAAIFAVVSAAHWLRLVLGTEITLGGAPIPPWVSFVAGVVAALLAAWMAVAGRGAATPGKDGGRGWD